LQRYYICTRIETIGCITNLNIYVVEKLIVIVLCKLSPWEEWIVVDVYPKTVVLTVVGVAERGLYDVPAESATFG
jgi:hypothetical protein